MKWVYGIYALKQIASRDFPELQHMRLVKSQLPFVVCLVVFFLKFSLEHLFSLNASVSVNVARRNELPRQNEVLLYRKAAFLHAIIRQQSTNPVLARSPGLYSRNH